MSVGLGLVAAASIVVQALAIASLLAAAMGQRAPDPLPALVWLAGAVAVRGLAALAAELTATWGGEQAKAELRASLVGAALRQAPGGSGVSPAEVAIIAGRGLDALDPYIGRCLPDLVLAAAVPVALAAVIGRLDWLSGLVVLVCAALFPLFGFLVGEASTGLAERRWHQVEAFGRQVTDVFEGLPVLKAFGHAARQRDRIAQAGEALRQASLSTLRIAFLSALVLDTLASVSVAMVAVPLGLRLLGGSVTLPAALAVLIVAPEVFLPLRRASADFHDSTEGLAAARRAMDVIAAGGERGRGAGATARRSSGAGTAPGFGPPATPALSAALPPDPARAPVALEGVVVGRSGRDRPILDVASLRIAPGETVVLVGANGTGKSTTLALLLGFLIPEAGRVTVGGEDLGRIELRAWRRCVAYLPEHPALLSGSLAANLRLADPGATEDRLLEALGRAGAGDLVAHLPDGLATRVGEGGRPVSAGERQRIALARTLLRPASLHLLDEPTVHLDQAAEDAVVEALRDHLIGRSALIVTHRSAVARLADRVVALRDGRFVDATGARWGARSAAVTTAEVTG
jgi:ATP-binding cassette subfamily C protein CydD